METVMKSALRLTAGVAVAIFAAACADVGGTSANGAVGEVAAFESVPAGFSSTSSSFAATGDLGGAFLPHRGDGSFDDDSARGPELGDDHGGRGRGGHGRGGEGGFAGGPGHGFGRGDGFGFLMGGGLEGDFLGEIGFGPGRGRGPFHVDSVGSSCVFSGTTGVVTCGPVTRGGLTVTSTAAITTADGTAQSKIDATTDKVVLHSEVSGSVTRRDSATSVIAHTSDRTITGLAAGSTQRTVEGVAVGTETTTGTTDSSAAFTAIRTVNDTTSGIVIPLENGRPTYPSAGRVSRNMSVSITIDGTTTTHSRSEVVTYDGTATASVVITQDGTAKTCTLPLPRGRLTCQ
jgi:hypothetical protein